MTKTNNRVNLFPHLQFPSRAGVKFLLQFEPEITSPPSCQEKIQIVIADEFNHQQHLGSSCCCKKCN